jgi:hypothetical protein
MMAVFFLLIVCCLLRDPRALYVDPALDGDCFSLACSLKTAALVMESRES